MNRYVTRAAYHSSDRDGEVAMTADQVIDTDRTPVATGLLDQYGREYMRVADTVQFGFVSRVR